MATTFNINDYQIIDVPQEDGTTMKMLVPKDKPGMWTRLKNWWGSKSTGEKIAIIGCAGTLGFLGLSAINTGVNLAQNASNLRLNSGSTDPEIDTTYLDSTNLLDSAPGID